MLFIPIKSITRPKTFFESNYCHKKFFLGPTVPPPPFTVVFPSHRFALLLSILLSSSFSFSPTIYLLLTHYHLGLPLLPAAAAGTPCDHCGQPLDVSCRFAGSWKRHNKFCNAVATIAESVGILKGTEVEVSGRERPADLLIAHWSHGRGAAVDPTIIHSLNPCHPWDPHHFAMGKAEAGKHTKPTCYVLRQT